MVIARDREEFAAKLARAKMNRIVAAAAAIAVVVAAIAAWSNFVIVEPETGAAVAQAAGRGGPPIISPREIVQNYGAMLPVEDWRPTN
jgi:hypothetical protein